MTKKQLFRISTACTALAASLLSAGVSAQEVAGSTATPQSEDANAGGLTDIVVTAQRRVEKAQNVPISITVLGANQLRALQSSNDIGQIVPNAQVSSAVGFGIPRTSIRGIAQGDFNATSTTSNMIYLDDVPLNATIAQGLPVWDLERAEVLRGPQGTLFGRNATGGAIRYISAMPTDELEGYADVTIGRFDQNEVRASLGGPVTNTLKVRLSYLGYRRDGDVYNRILDVKQGKQAYYGVRGIVVWDPTPELNLTLRAQYFKSSQEVSIWKSTPGVVAGDAFGPAPSPLVNGYTSVAQLVSSYGSRNDGAQNKFSVSEADGRPEERLTHLPVSLTGNLQLGSVTLTAITAYLRVRHASIADNDSTPAPILTEYDRNSDRQWTQEVRLTSDNDGPFNWIAGGFYMNEKVNADLNFQATAWRGNVDYGFPDASTVLYRRGAKQTTESWAGFAHATYQITPKLLFTAAARYTWEAKKIGYTFRSQWNFPSSAPRTSFEFTDFIRAVDTVNLGTQLAAANAPISAKKSWSQVTWKLGLDYKLTPYTLLYGYISRGFKGGSFKPTANTAAEVLNPNGSILSVDPETVTDFELGVKSDIVPGKVRVNAGAFYYDYRDYQTNQLDPGTASQLLSNLPKSRAVGAELELDIFPVPHLNISAGAGYLSTKIVKSPDPSLIGNKLPLAEDFNLNAMIRYDIVTPIGTISPEVSGKHYGNYFTTKENDKKLGNYQIFNARVAFESDSKSFYGSVWVKNFTNKVVPIVVDDPSEFFGGDIAFINARRSFGATVGARF